MPLQTLILSSRKEKGEALESSPVLQLKVNKQVWISHAGIKTINLNLDLEPFFGVFFILNLVYLYLHFTLPASRVL